MLFKNVVVFLAMASTAAWAAPVAEQNSPVPRDAEIDGIQPAY